MKQLGLILLLCLVLVITGCVPERPGPPTQLQPTQQQTRQPIQVTGRFDIQSIAYNDLDGTYETTLLDRTPPLLTTTNVKLTLLTEEEIESKTPIYAEVKNDETVMHIAQDTKINYIRTETAVAPTNEQPQQVIVQGQRENFWVPFAEGFLISQIFNGNRYYPVAVYPPPYIEGRPMVGVGGYGRSNKEARDNYAAKHKAPPPAVKHNKLRASGNLTAKPGTKLRGNTARSLSSSPRITARTTNKPTGKGIGGSNLKSPSTFKNSPPSRSFGSRSKSYVQPQRSYSAPSRSFRAGRRR